MQKKENKLKKGKESKMKTMKRALTLIMAIMMVAAMAACGNKPAASNGDETTGDGSLKRVQDAGKLIVACETS